MPHHKSARIVIQSLWKRLPQRAMELTQESVFRGDERLQHWFESAPPETHPQLLELLEMTPSSLQPWAQMWLARWLPNAGPLADRIHALWMRSTQSGLSEARM